MVTALLVCTFFVTAGESGSARGAADKDVKLSGCLIRGEGDGDGYLLANPPTEPWLNSPGQTGRAERPRNERRLRDDLLLARRRRRPEATHRPPRRGRGRTERRCERRRDHDRAERQLDRRDGQGRRTDDESARPEHVNFPCVESRQGAQGRHPGSSSRRQARAHDQRVLQLVASQSTKSALASLREPGC